MEKKHGQETKRGFGAVKKLIFGIWPAQIPISGHYDPEKTVASFIGFAPADNPQFLMLITLREPATSPWASETAAPLWFEIAREIFTIKGINPK